MLVLTGGEALSSGKVFIGIRKSIPFRFVSFLSIVSSQSVSHTFLFSGEKKKASAIVEAEAILKRVRVRAHSPRPKVATAPSRLHQRASKHSCAFFFFGGSLDPDFNISPVFLNIFLVVSKKRCVRADELFVKNGDMRDTGTGKMIHRVSFRSQLNGTQQNFTCAA